MTGGLEFDRVTRVFTGGASEKTALNGVSCEIPPGEIVSIVGRSGSGKSTLLHLAAGIETPTSGRIVLHGASLSSMSERERTLVRRDQIGLVFQFFHLLPQLSVRENVALPQMIAGEKKRVYENRVVELLTRVGMEDRADDPAGVLSGGEMQRVAICRALVRNPRMILADEPTGNLDDLSAEVVIDLLFGVARDEGSALLLVTHDGQLAARADRCWRLHDGRLET